MAESGQDFDVYAGDSCLPVITVFTDKTLTTPADLRAAAEIVWLAEDEWAGADVLEKKKTAGDITFVTDGQDGKIVVDIEDTDTKPLGGAYPHRVVVTDSGGEITTVTTGLMNVRERVST